MTDSRRINTVDVAKLIRVELKKTFPKTKFSVRSSIYAGGSSIRVHWTDGPTKKRVEEVIGHFEGASFDGIIDLKSYHDSEWNGEKVHFGNDFLFCERSYSPAFVARVAEEAEKRTGWPIPRTMVEAQNVAYGGSSGNGWRDDYCDVVIRTLAEDRNSPRFIASNAPRLKLHS
jgi:hypothetical protein